MDSFPRAHRRTDRSETDTTLDAPRSAFKNPKTRLKLFSRLHNSETEAAAGFAHVSVSAGAFETVRTCLKTGRSDSVAVVSPVVIPEGDLLLAVAVVVVVASEIGPGFIPDIQSGTRMGFSPRDMYSLLEGQSRALKRAFSLDRDARTKVRAYLRSKNRTRNMYKNCHIRNAFFYRFLEDGRAVQSSL